MNLGLLLPLGDSLKSFAAHGQDVRFVNYYLKCYCEHFDKVYLFSYEKEAYLNLPKNCTLVCPDGKPNRFLYGLGLPLLQSKQYRRCDMFRCFHPSAIVPALVGKLFFRKKFVFNFNYDYQSLAKVEGKGGLIPLLKVIEALGFRFADKVFVADEAMQRYVNKPVKSTKITLIRNGADTTLFKPISKRLGNSKLILSVGRLDPAKNYEQLIEAVSTIKPKVSLLLVGKGYLKAELQSLAKKLRVKLKIIDMVPHDKLPAVYNSADVYVQCSLREAPVKTLLEAMSCGRPCVGTNVPGIRDVIADMKDGLLVNLSVSGIKKGIETLLTDPGLALRLGKIGRQKIINKYSLQRYLELEVKVLKSI